MIPIQEASQWIGYAVLLGAGLVVASLSVFAGIACVWNIWRKGLNAMDVFAATKEWRERHPDRAARWAKRNGFGPEEG